VLRDAGLDPKELEGMKFYRGRGCSKCNNTGYRGRDGIFEVMTITPRLREMIIQKASSAELKEQAIKEGMLTLRQSGLLKFKRGVSTLEEILKETSLT